MVDTIIASLDHPVSGEELARRIYLSRFYFDRLVAAALGESPASFRRRLLLERAAFALGRDESVLEAALDAGYSSPEAFSRAFERAFGMPPSSFRGDFRLPSPNGVHFQPPGGLLVPAGTERSATMDLTDRMLEHDLWLTARLIDAAGELPDERLDEPVPTPTEPPHAWFEDGDPTLRSMLDRLVYSKESGRPRSWAMTSPNGEARRSRSCASGTGAPESSSRMPSEVSATATPGTPPL
jgi:AraC family transcriptional regulator